MSVFPFPKTFISGAAWHRGDCPLAWKLAGQTACFSSFSASISAPNSLLLPPPCPPPVLQDSAAPRCRPESSLVVVKSLSPTSPFMPKLKTPSGAQAGVEGNSLCLPHFVAVASGRLSGPGGCWGWVGGRGAGESLLPLAC